jgi:gamma-glutamylputrescine oxidase
MGFTPDGLPLVGRLPDLPQAYFAVGLGGRGLAWAFVLAERLVDLMLRGTAPGILAADRLT